MICISPEAEDWRISGYTETAVDEATKNAMTRNGVMFGVHITPDPRFGRSALYIHPDGNLPGTAGCVGLTGSFYELSDFSDRIRGYLRIHRSMTLRVRGTYNPIAK